MKRVFAPLLALCLALSLVLPAFAANEYGLVYDQTGKITKETAESIDEFDLAPIDQEYGIEMRLHLVSDLGGKTIEDYAKDTYLTTTATPTPAAVCWWWRRSTRTRLGWPLTSTPPTPATS